MSGARAKRRKPRGSRAGRSRARGSRLARLSAGQRLLLGAVVLAAAWLLLNWCYQVARKPSELLFPVSGTLNKTPVQTWHDYGPLFERFSTALIAPDLLAALAQVEGSGNPAAQTYWRWSWRPAPFEIYRPASSAVGMYQLTNATFAAARKLCIRDHRVIADGPWNDWNSCWFNGLYSRVVPAHAVELTAAYLDRAVAGILERHAANRSTSAERRQLAALIHLCGAGAGEAYAERGLHLVTEQRCGDHDARQYIERVEAASRLFAQLRAQDRVP